MIRRPWSVATTVLPLLGLSGPAACGSGEQAGAASGNGSSSGSDGGGANGSGASSTGAGSSSSGGSGSGGVGSDGSGSGAATPIGGSASGSSGTGPSPGSSGADSGTASSGSGPSGSDGSSGGTGSSSGSGVDGASGGSSSSGSGSGASSGRDAGPNATSTATRPQLTDAQAASNTVLAYLAQAGTIGSLVTDNWNPTTGLGDASKFTASFTVAADGSGTHTTVQAAIDAATGSSRVYILVEPGAYREVVCVKTTAPPITLYGTSTDATKVVIVFNNQASSGGITTANPCSTSTSGTSATATVMAFANGFQAKNLTISNDFASPTGTYQAVALMTQADQIVLENVRLHGYQDTFFMHTSAVTTVARVYVKNSFIEGDTDFVFGRATAVMDGCTINYLSSRKQSGTILAPSTDPRNSYGFLVFASNLTSDAGTTANSVYLGRAWDNGVAAGGYVPGTSPNGQAVIAESALAVDIRMADPWAVAATSGRAFSSTGANANRLYEYRNSGPGAAP